MQTISRRQAIRGATLALALAPLPAAALAVLPADHPDAEMLRLEAELDAASETYEAAIIAFDRADSALWVRDGDDKVLDASADHLKARQNGALVPFRDARDDAQARWEAAREAIAEAEAHSFAGLLIKARLVNADVGDGEGVRYAGEQIADSLVADLARLAGRA